MLQKQIIDISLAQGLNQITEEKISQEGSIVLSNAHFNKVGEISKVKGYTLIGGIPNRSIVTDAKGAVHAMGEQGVYSLSSNGWVVTSNFNGGPLVETSFINNDTYDHTETDIAYSGTHVAHVAIIRKGASSPKTLITLECLETGVKISKEDTAVNRRTPKIFIHQGEIYLFYYDFDIESYVGLKKYDLSLTETLSKKVSPYNNAGNIYGLDACYDETFMCFYVIHPEYQNSVMTDKVIRVDLVGNIVSSIVPTPERALLDSVNDYATFAICSTLDYVVTLTRNIDDEYTVTVYGKGLAIVKRELFTYVYGLKATISPVSNNQFVAAFSVEEKTYYDGAHHYSALSTFPFSVAGSVITPGISLSFPRMTLASKAFTKGEDVYCISNLIDDSNAHFYILNLTDGTVLGRFSPETAVRTDQPFMAGDYHAFTSLSKVVEIDTGKYVGSIVRKKAVDQSDERRVLSSVSSVRVDLDFSENIYSKALVGDSLLVTNGLTIEVDSGRAYENGFLASPDVYRLETSYDTFNNGHPSKTYSYCVVYEYYDADGQLTRSAPSALKTITTPATTSYMTVSFLPPINTFKGMGGTTSKDPFTVIYRTQHNGTVFYRCGETLAGATSFDDATLDIDLSSREMLYTTGGVLQNDPAPIAKYSTSGGSRIFLAGLEVDEVAFSKKYLTGESVAFSDLFRISLATGGSLDRSKVSGLGYMDGKLIIFRKRSIYVVQGDGPNELGQNDSFTFPEIISGDIGCISHASIVNIPDGIIFQSDKGIWLLSRGLALSYLGAGVDDLGRDLITNAIVSDRDSEARFYTNTGKCLIYNFTLGQWSSCNITATSSDILNGDVILTNGYQIKKESGFTDIALPYSMTVKTPWFKTSSIQGFARVWTAKILGKYKSAHKLRVRVYYDYKTTGYDEYIREPKLADGQYQYEIHLKRQKCESIQFEITDTNQSGTCESMSLTGITLEAGVRKGSFKLPATRRT